MMGYQYEKRKDHKGNEHGVCVFPDKSECDVWDFYRGKAGRAFSYCEKMGYTTESKKINQGTYETECAVCVSKSKGIQGKKEIPQLELMRNMRWRV